MTNVERVHAETPTRVWINNPTSAQATDAAGMGVENCTTNPAYGSKIIPQLSEKDAASLIESVAADTSATPGVDGVDAAVDAVQCRLVADILPAFAAAYDRSEGRSGFVSIQPNPFRDDEEDFILAAAERHRAVGSNVINKIPATSAGIAAMKALFRQGYPAIATEMFTVAQTRAVCETYAAAGDSSSLPVLFITHITGIYEEYVARHALPASRSISPDVLADGCFALAKRCYHVMKSYNLPIVLLGGGVRNIRHLTDYLGSDMHVTINPADIDALNAASALELSLFTRPVNESAVEQLMDVPVFSSAWKDDGLSADEFQEYPPVQYFLDSFRKGWNFVRDAVRGT